MIGVDTNVLVRFLVADDVEQTKRAAAVIQRAAKSGEPLFVSDVVLCEVVWVLETSYKIPSEEVARTLTSLLDARHLQYRNRAALREALDGYVQTRGDFADYVILGHAIEAGCTSCLTFDGALLASPGFASP
ncbi:MAG: type II toxin-antitoxin system VapC family toxin [Planctomycetes bacterium]|nr:type II toxin-antitoxin system VapC family toxin [Planctomycetota bacterium]